MGAKYAPVNILMLYSLLQNTVNMSNACGFCSSRCEVLSLWKPLVVLFLHRFSTIAVHGLFSYLPGTTALHVAAEADLDQVIAFLVQRSSPQALLIPDAWERLPLEVFLSRLEAKPTDEIAALMIKGMTPESWVISGCCSFFVCSWTMQCSMPLTSRH